MISKAWATMRTAKSFFPLLRPFIIRLNENHRLNIKCEAGQSNCDSAPIYQSLNNRHLRLLKLLLSITASSMRKIDSVADLNVVG